MTGCGANLAGGVRRACRTTSSSCVSRSERDARVRRRRRRRDRLRPGRRRLDRVRALRQDPGRLLLLVPLLRHPARPRRHAQPARRRRARRDRRRVAQGHREVVLTGINLGCFRDREAGYALAAARARGRRVAGLARLRLSSIEVNHVDDELVAALRETPTVARHLHVPLQSGDDGVLRAMGRRYTVDTYLRRLEPLAGLQPHDRRDRRLPDRGRARVRAHARTSSSGRHRRRCTSSRTRRGPGTGTAERTRCRPQVKKERSARLRAPPTKRAAAAGGDEGRPRGRRARRPAGPRLRRRLLAVARSTAPVGELVRVRGARPSRRRGSLPLTSTTASSAGSSARASTSHATDGFVAIRDINPKADVHLLVLPERHVDTFRDVVAFTADEAKRMLDFVAETAAAGRPRGLPGDRQRRRGRRARPSSTCTGTSSAVRYAGCRHEPDRPDRGASSRTAMRERDAERRDALRLILTSLRSAEKELQRPLHDDEELQVLQRERKRRLEAAEAFRAGRPRGAGRAPRSASSRCSRSSCRSRSPRTSSRRSSTT